MLHVWVFYSHACLCIPCMLGDCTARTGVPDSSEPPCECWEQNPDPLEDPPELLTSEPSLQPERKRFKLEPLATERSQQLHFPLCSLFIIAFIIVYSATLALIKYFH